MWFLFEILDIDNLGGIESTICICSFFTLISSIFILLRSHKILRVCSIDLDTAQLLVSCICALDTRRYDIYTDSLYEIIFPILSQAFSQDLLNLFI